VRLFFFSMLLAGLVGAFGYPWMTERLSDAQIGVVPIYDRVSGLSKAEIKLEPPQAPFRIFLRMTTQGNFSRGSSKTEVRLYGILADRVEFISEVTFSAAKGVTPQINGSVYEALAGTLPVENSGNYTFYLSTRGFEGIPIETVDLIVRGRLIEIDKRIQIAGLLAAALGLAGLVFWSIVKKSISSLHATPFGAKVITSAAIASLLVVSALSLAGSQAVGNTNSWYTQNVARRELGRFVIFDRPTGFKTVMVNLAPDQSPAQLSFELTPLGNYQKPFSTTKLAINVSLYKSIISTSGISFTNANEAPKIGPDPTDKIFHSAKRSFAVERAGSYAITASLEGAEQLSMHRIHMVVASSSREREDFRKVMEIALLTIGGVSGVLALLLVLVRRATTAADRPKWGRDAGV
jgi:hypothetical protein